MISIKPTMTAMALILMFTGCGPKNTAEHSGTTGSLIIGQTTAWYATEGEGIAVLLWSNVPAAASGSNGTASGARGYHGSLTSEGRRVDIECETKDGKTGKVTLNGTAYDLAAGAVFLASGTNGLIHIAQLKRDTSQLKPTIRSLEEFAKKDPDIAPFIAASGKPKA
jgi:hypothetical protein